MKITSFRDLDAWNVAMELALHIYDAVKRLPAQERYDVMQAASVSGTGTTSESRSAH